MMHSRCVDCGDMFIYYTTPHHWKPIAGYIPRSYSKPQVYRYKRETDQEHQARVDAAISAWIEDKRRVEQEMAVWEKLNAVDERMRDHFEAANAVLEWNADVLGEEIDVPELCYECVSNIARHWGPYGVPKVLVYLMREIKYEARKLTERIRKLRKAGSA